MGKYRGPKIRLSRREGVDLGMKTVGSHAHATLLRRLTVPPGQHGPKGSRRKVSDYGRQLREKQKVKRLYGMLERQFRKNFEIAKKVRGNTGDTIIQLLERRLDNTLYRMALSPTRASARQFIGHGHIQVNGKKLTIPSYLVKTGDVINLTAKGAEIPAVKKLLEDKTPTVPAWIERKGPAGKIVRLSERVDVTEDINEQLIIEFYSR